MSAVKIDEFVAGLVVIPGTVAVGKITAAEMGTGDRVSQLECGCRRGGLPALPLARS